MGRSRQSLARLGEGGGRSRAGHRAREGDSVTAPLEHGAEGRGAWAEPPRAKGKRELGLSGLGGGRGDSGGEVGGRGVETIKSIEQEPSQVVGGGARLGPDETATHLNRNRLCFQQHIEKSKRKFCILQGTQNSSCKPEYRKEPAPAKRLFKHDHEQYRSLSVLLQRSILGEEFYRKKRRGTVCDPNHPNPSRPHLCSFVTF